MQLRFERGSPDAPRGHALLYVRDLADPDVVFATYLVVLPIRVDITKYIPPMLAGSMALGEMGSATAVPWPPVPERVESRAYLEGLAEHRDDDLVFCDSVDSTRVELLLQSIGEAAQSYQQLYSRREPPATGPAAAGPADSAELDVDEVLYGLMGEHDRLTELVKLTGRLRDAVEAGDQKQAEETIASLEKLARHFPAKYRLDKFVAAARMPGELGRRLTELYVERCYRVRNEDYEGLRQVDDQIEALSPWQ